MTRSALLPKASDEWSNGIGPRECLQGSERERERERVSEEGREGEHGSGGHVREPAVRESESEARQSREKGLHTKGILDATHYGA